MNKRLVFGLMVFILMIVVFALPTRLVAAKDPGGFAIGVRSTFPQLLQGKAITVGARVAYTLVVESHTLRRARQGRRFLCRKT